MTTFYMDYDLGSDAVRATLTDVVFSNPSGDTVLGTKVAHGLVTGARITVSGCTQAYANTAWNITWVSADTFSVDSASWASWNGADVTGDVVPFGGQSWTDAWKTITSGATEARIAPADVIRIAKSPDPVSLGCTGVWTDAPDTLPTSQNIESSTNASPIEITITGHGRSTGEAVYIQNHTTNLTANGTWTITWVDANKFTLDGSTGVGVGGATGDVTMINWHCVKLATAQTKTIDRTEVAWTASGSSTVTLDTTQYKSGDASTKVVKSSPANSTLYAYKAIGGGAGVDFSGYQKVSFWMRNSTAITANQWDLCLCSDAAGATVVDTIAIQAIPSTNQWTVLTVARNGGGNLGASIQSVALYSGSSAGTTAGIFLDNIIACTTSGLNLQSLISKNSAAQGGTEGWYGIQSISEDGKVIRLDNHTNRLASENITTRGGGYSGTTETVTTYKRETIKTSIVSGSTTQVQAIQNSGTGENNIQFQGGYNPATNLQNGETFFDGLNGAGVGITATSKSFVTLNFINGCRYYYGIFLNSSHNNAISFARASNNNYLGIYLNGSYNNNIDTAYTHNNQTNGLYYSYCHNNFANVLITNNNGSYGINTTDSDRLIISTITAYNNINYGIYIYSTNTLIKNITTNKNNAGCANSKGKNYIQNALISETTEVAGYLSFANSRLFSQNHDQTADNHWIFTDGGTINSLATDRVGGTGIMWKSAITSANRSSSYPLDLSIAKIAVAANAVVTVKAYIKKSHATNIGCKLVYRGGQIAGLASDVTVTKANDTNWEELTLTLNQPTAAGVIEIEFWTWYIAANGNGFIEDMTITQA